MSMQWVRSAYAVPAKRGGRVRFDGQPGRITYATPGRGLLALHLDGTPEKERVWVHPTWRMEYLDGQEKA